MDMPAAIIIPTFNRVHLISQAVEAALHQTHPDAIVIVVDDGSIDATQDVLARYDPHPQFCRIALSRNLGTAAAKNVGIVLAGARAITFHDSDDIPNRDKVLRQSRCLSGPDIGADPCLNWTLAGHNAGDTLRVGAVFAHHDLVLPDGRKITIRRPISLVDDIFPNLQMGTYVPGEWMHINSGLFHPDVFARLGGFSDCIEEDREFRNRLILGGEVIWVIEDVLLTKIETPDSLTQSGATDYNSTRRASDRRKVWDKVEHWLATRQVQPEAINLPPSTVAFVSRPDLIAPSRALMTDATRSAISVLFQSDLAKAV